MQRTVYHIKTPKDAHPELVIPLFSSLTTPRVPWYVWLLFPPAIYTFEIVWHNNTIEFYVTAPPKKAHLVKSILEAAYPKGVIAQAPDPLVKLPHMQVGEILIGEVADKPATDPLLAVTGFLSKQPQHTIVTQLIVSAPSTQTPGGRAGLRILAPTVTIVREVIASYAGAGEMHPHIPVLFGYMLTARTKERSFPYFERRDQVIAPQHLAQLWHPAGVGVGGVKNITWGKTIHGEAPAALPTDGTPLGQALHKNEIKSFGIRPLDRRRHMYIVGKTGSGKSTLIANMAISDIRAGLGVGIIDPHGDLTETILDYIPKRRIDDVVYLEPFDQTRPFTLNVLSGAGHRRDLVASGIVAIFAKLYADNWGPRSEYILRNVILTLLEYPPATLIDVLPLLSNKEFRQKVLTRIHDPILNAFWHDEFEAMPQRFRSEVISPIQNKVGQFVQSPMIRAIIGNPRSTIDLERIINGGQVLIVNLSQGKLGEDNAALLGAMIITKLQLAAMNRAYLPEEDRRDFMLYVDEFQNFATSSFIKILSEARKYRLGLTLTNQYIEQLGDGIQKALFGNVGSLVSFIVGARDAAVISREYGGIYTPQDLVSLKKHEIILNLSIDGMTSVPFPANTLPLPRDPNGQRIKIITQSKMRYGIIKK